MDLPAEMAETAARVLVTADLRGVDSHGVARLSGYVRLCLTSGTIARNNRVYGNSVYGMQLSDGQAYNNVIYSNAIGMYVGASGNQIGNNLIYGNATVGIDHNWQTSSSVFNNTIYQLTGDAIRATAGRPATAVCRLEQHPCGRRRILRSMSWLRTRPHSAAAITCSN